MVERIWNALTACLDDYTVDSRGDVGSWVRMAACESVISVFKNTGGVDVKLVMTKLLRLSAERLDKVRSVAGRSVCALASLWPDAEETLQAFIRGYTQFSILWN